jgi:phosphoribosylglycinamide formyltransferase-1
MIRLGILGSTRGTDLQAIIDAIAKRQLAAEISVVISDKQNAYILERAITHELNAIFADPKNKSREEFDSQLSEILHTNNVELIILIGYMRILSKEFVAEWRGKIINVHPSLLPAFAGGMDSNVHQAVLDAGVKETGCTVHYVTEEVDAGPILIQKKCAVLADDTVDSLKARVQKLEGDALVEAVNNLSPIK